MIADRCALPADPAADRLIEAAGEPPASLYAEIEATLTEMDRTLDAMCALLGLPACRLVPANVPAEGAWTRYVRSER